MKKLSLFVLPLLALSLSAQAKSVSEKDLECHREARAAVQKETGARPSQIKFWQGAQLGDGAASLEISLYLVNTNGSDAAYKVEFNAEDCGTPLSLDRID
ncbi:MAG: hypothetical protein EOP11_16870 [Proteobacteria bacterium]|nr:MAG: hypothetical protein EOP11_16870 [Pseudomonadota bacterium]